MCKNFDKGHQNYFNIALIIMVSPSLLLKKPLAGLQNKYCSLSAGLGNWWNSINTVR
jgi:hypothetical protein